MSLPKKFYVAAACGLAVIAGAHAASAAEFTYNEKTNADLAKKLKIPVYFAVPASARAPLSKDIKTTDKLYDFKHPDALKAKGDVGLRLVREQTREPVALVEQIDCPRGAGVCFSNLRDDLHH